MRASKSISLPSKPAWLKVKNREYSFSPSLSYIHCACPEW